MSTKSENVEIAVLQNQMNTVQGDVTEMKGDIKTIIATLDGNFVSKTEFKTFRDGYEAYKKSQLFQKIIIAFGFSFIGGLIGFFFNKVGK